jgi:hypothetical protein
LRDVQDNVRDIFGLWKSDFKALKERDGLVEIPFELPQKIKAPFSVVRDERSFGIAYLAKRMEWIPLSHTAMEEIHPPFIAGSDDYKRFIQAVRLQQERLSQLSFRSALVEREGVQGFADGDPSNQMNIANISGNKAAFEVDCQVEPCVLVFNSAALSAWRAFAGSIPLPIRRANFAFLSVEVPQGKHFVWFEYRSTASLVGMFLTLLNYTVGFWFVLSNIIRKGPLSFPKI